MQGKQEPVNASELRGRLGAARGVFVLTGSS
jgi:hypothetical protein